MAIYMIGYIELRNDFLVIDYPKLLMWCNNVNLYKNDAHVKIINGNCRNINEIINIFPSI